MIAIDTRQLMPATFAALRCDSVGMPRFTRNGARRLHVSPRHPYRCWHLFSSFSLSRSERRQEGGAAMLDPRASCESRKGTHRLATRLSSSRFDALSQLRGQGDALWSRRILRYGLDQG